MLLGSDLSRGFSGKNFAATATKLLSQHIVGRTARDFWWTQPAESKEKKPTDEEGCSSDGSASDDEETTGPKAREQQLRRLNRAASVGDADEIERLISSRANPNARDNQGRSPLFQAGVNGMPSAVACLMLARADPTQTSQAGQSALAVASNPEVEALMEALAPCTANTAPNIFVLDQAVAKLPENLRDRFEREANSSRRLHTHRQRQFLQV